MRILAFAASLRQASLNRKLIALAIAAAREAHVEVDAADFREFDMPLYDGDIEAGSGIPEGGQKLVQRLSDAHGFMLSAPEYNFSMPGTLKNAIDWVSRARPMPLKGHVCFLMGASPSLIGTQRGLWQLRQPLESLGCFVVPFMFTLPQADKAFDESGQLADEKRRDTLATQVRQFIDCVGALRASELNDA